VDQKTALENQVLGSYEELGKDMMLLASVRSVDETGKLKLVAEVPKSKMEAIRAMQRQEFNRDDIQMFKVLGVGVRARGITGCSFFLKPSGLLRIPISRNFPGPSSQRKMRIA